MVGVRKALSYLRPRWEAVLAVVLVTVAVGAFVWLARYVDRFIVDDAGISIAFARSLADGDGLRPTPYSGVVEGFSNPTWTLFLAVCEKVGLNSMRPAKWVGFALAASAFPLMALWGPVSQQRRLRIDDAAGPLVACTNASLAYWALGGLEIGLLLFLLALYGVLLFAPRTRRNAIAVGVTAGSIVLTRPEAVLYVGTATLPWLIDAAIRRRRPTRLDGLAALAGIGLVGAYFGFRELYFGAPFPNTYYAKRSWFVGIPNLEEVNASIIQSGRDFYTLHRPLFIVGGVAALASVAGGLKVLKTSLGAVLTALAMFFFYWYANGDWMKEWRFLAPALPFLAYPVSAGATGLRALAERVARGRSRRLAIGAHVVVGAVAIAALVWTAKTNQTRWLDVKKEGGDTPLDPNDRPKFGQDVRRLVRAFHMSHPLVAGPDMGWTSLGLRDSELIDLAGLANMTIARQYANPNALRDFFTNEGSPTILMLWGPSNNLRKLPEFLGRYRNGPGKYSSYMIYGGVTETTDDRCPEGKDAAMQSTRPRMLESIGEALRGNDAVKALARWRCYLAYRQDADLPTADERLDVARTARSMALSAEKEGNPERALRDYSLCAVIGAPSFRPSVSCRLRAESLRGKLFPRVGRR